VQVGDVGQDARRARRVAVALHQRQRAASCVLGGLEVAAIAVHDAQAIARADLEVGSRSLTAWSRQASMAPGASSAPELERRGRA
jgi:hypothetical protein